MKNIYKSDKFLLGYLEHDVSHCNKISMKMLNTFALFRINDDNDDHDGDNDNDDDDDDDDDDDGMMMIIMMMMMMTLG